MLDPKIYNRLFQQDRDGAAVLEELAALFYDKPSYREGGNVNDALFREGRRDVVRFILNKSGIVEGANDGDI